MTCSPYPVEGITLARRTLTDGAYMASITPKDRAELVQMAFDILHKDRAARLQMEPPAPEDCRVITIPRAVFQAGRQQPRRRPRLTVLPAGPTPGDAA